MIPFWHSVFKDDMTYSVCSPYLMRDFTHMFLPFPTVHPSPHLTSRCTLKRGASILLPLHNQTVRRRKPYPKTNSSWKLMVGRQLSLWGWPIFRGKCFNGGTRIFQLSGARHDCTPMEHIDHQRCLAPGFFCSRGPVDTVLNGLYRHLSRVQMYIL